MTQKTPGPWNTGQKMGIRVFLFLMVVLILVDSIVIPDNWQMTATSTACIIEWQVVGVAYHRGFSDANNNEEQSA